MPRLFLAWVALTLAIGVAPAHAITPTDAVSRINALRVQNSLPPLIEDPLLSRECQAHARYMALNDGWDEEQPHGETPGRPGYSDAGARAARQSVLAGPAGWTDPHPWVESAEHVRLIMDPELQRTGYGEQDGWACLQVIKRPRPDLAGQVFTFPGPGGVLPEDASALIVYTPNADVTFTDPRLTGPDGPSSRHQRRALPGTERPARARHHVPGGGRSQLSRGRLLARRRASGAPAVPGQLRPLVLRVLGGLRAGLAPRRGGSVRPGGVQSRPAAARQPGRDRQGPGRAPCVAVHDARRRGGPVLGGRSLRPGR